jgi:DNA repair exonuclease SbcCD ATPase subunit
MFTKNGKLKEEIVEQLHRVSWGFGDDAINQIISKEDEILYDEVLDLDSLKKRKNLTEKQKKIISKLENYEEKVLNLQNKLQNLQKDPTLESKIETINEKLENLIGEKELAEENLRSSFFPGMTSTKKTVKGEYDYSSSEDEYYNRAKIVPDKGLSNNAQLEYDKLVLKRQEIASEIAELSVSLEDKDDDPLDAYMIENNSELKEENLKKLGSRLKEVLIKIEAMEKNYPGIKPSFNLFTAPKDIRIGPKKRKIEENIPNSPKPKEFDHNSDWIPPSNQAGDGKTELNSKYNY